MRAGKVDGGGFNRLGCGSGSWLETDNEVAGRELHGDNAAAAKAIVAAWQELEVGRALHIHHTQMVVCLLRWSGVSGRIWALPSDN